MGGWLAGLSGNIDHLNQIEVEVEVGLGLSLSKFQPLWPARLAVINALKKCGSI